jgi:hypothetical protein
MSIVSVSYACLVAGAAARRLGWLWMAAILALVSGTGTFLVKHTWWDPDNLATMHDAMDEGQGFDGTDEYDPQGDDRSNLPMRAPLAQPLPLEGVSLQRGDVNVQIPLWTTNEKRVRVKSRERVRLALRVLNYPAWRVEVNGHAIKPESAEDDGQMIVTLDSGESQITASFTRTKDRTAGMGITFGSVLLALGLAMRRKRGGN